MLSQAARHGERPRRLAIAVASSTVTAFDLFLLFFAFWCLVVPVLLRARPELPLPFGGRLTAEPSAKHLLEFWILLFVRQLPGLGSEKALGLPRLVKDFSANTRGLLVFMIAIVVFLAASPERGISGDTIGAKLIPVSLLEEGDLDLDEFVHGILPPHRYCVTNVGGHYYSRFPIFTGLTALPFYALFSIAAPETFATWRLAYAVRGGDVGSNVANLLEQHVAAILAALSVVVVWAFSTRVSNDERFALWITAAYALGTPTLSTTSSALWMHGPSCLFLALTALFLLWSEERSFPWLLLAGACIAWAFACRPANAPAVAVLFVWVLFRHRTAAASFLIGAAVIFAAVAPLNYSVYGTLLGGYSGHMRLFGERFRPEVLATILFSPSRGLFVFCPFLVFSFIIAVHRLRDRPYDLRSLCFYAAIAIILPLPFYGGWAGGYSFGPRVLAESALFLCLALAWSREYFVRRRLAFVGLIVAILFSAHLHLLGTLRGDGGWTVEVFRGKRDVGIFWDLSDSQLSWTLG